MYKETFNHLMKLMKPFMKIQGFSSRGNNFYKRHQQGNIGIINVQRNKEGLPKFTINIGIYSVVLAKYFLAGFNQKEVKGYPALGDYHWETRIGFLVPKQNVYRQKDERWLKGYDKWWDYEDTTDVEALFREISELITEFAIPAIDKHITDEKLIEAWFPAVENDNQHLLKDLSVLLLAAAQKEKLKIVLDKLSKHLLQHPEFTGLKKHYDRLIREIGSDTHPSGNSEVLNFTSSKRKISEEESSSSDHKIKKIKP